MGNRGTALVTGSSTGIGKVICEHLLASGCEVVAMARRPTEIDHPRLHSISVDLADRAATAQAAREAARSAAQAAGMSRVTLHRIEAGEPSVTMGAYLNAMAALGLDFGIRTSASQAEAQSDALDAQATEVPARIRLADYPQLNQIA